MTAPYTITAVTMTGLDGLPHPVATGVVSAGATAPLIPGSQFALMALLDTTGTPLDPATSEGQTSIVAAITALTSQDAGLATNAEIITMAGGQGTGTPYNPPAGGSGLLGYLSGILKALSSALPLPTGAAADGTDATGVVQLTGGVGIRGWLSGIYSKLGSVVLAGGGAVIGGVTQSGNWALSAGSAVIGGVTQSGAWVLSASSAIIGKVGIDQTVPGTTNGVVVNGGSVTVSGSVTTTPVGTATQTTNTISSVAVSASSGALIAANAGRKSLSFMNTGASPVTITTANPAAFGAGIVLASGGTTQSQGGSLQYDSKVPTNAYYAICAAGMTSSIAVEEGN